MEALPFDDGPTFPFLKARREKTRGVPAGESESWGWEAEAALGLMTELSVKSQVGICGTGECLRVLKSLSGKMSCLKRCNRSTEYCSGVWTSRNVYLL